MARDNGNGGRGNMSDSVTIKVDGRTTLAKALKKLGADAQKDFERLVTKTALDIRRDVIKRYKSGPKTGAITMRGKREHQASAPGEAPAVDRGTLLSSLYFEQPTPKSATIGTRLAYGFYLEFGAKYIEKRPAWLPAAEASRPKFTKALEEIIRRHAR